MKNLVPTLGKQALSALRFGAFSIIGLSKQQAHARARALHDERT